MRAVPGHRTLIAFCALTVLGCVSSPHRRKSEVSEFLAVAANPDDPRFLATVTSVLTDIADHSYRFDDEVRKLTLQAIGRLRPDDMSLRQRVRAIAAMPITSRDSEKQLLDYVAVVNALGMLTDVKDTSAIDLNVLHLADPLLGPSAAENLHSLIAWTATGDVQRGLQSFLDSSHHDRFGASSYLLFLSDSPRTSSAICGNIARSLAEFEGCFAPSCNNGRAAAIDLKTRLRCSANRGRE